jgi:hypothetical protein
MFSLLHRMPDLRLKLKTPSSRARSRNFHFHCTHCRSGRCRGVLVERTAAPSSHRSRDTASQCSVHTQVNAIARQFESRKKNARRLCLDTQLNRAFVDELKSYLQESKSFRPHVCHCGRDASNPSTATHRTGSQIRVPDIHRNRSRRAGCFDSEPVGRARHRRTSRQRQQFVRFHAKRLYHHRRWI